MLTFGIGMLTWTSMQNLRLSIVAQGFVTLPALKKKDCCKPVACVMS